MKQANAINDFIGEGTTAVADCNVGKCPISETNWQGTLPAAGTYYIQVYNTSPTPMLFRIMIEGAGVTL